MSAKRFAAAGGGEWAGSARTGALGKQVVKLDTALLEASAPILFLTNGGANALKVAKDAIDLSRNAKLVATVPADALVKLNGSTLTIGNGSLVNLANGSFVTVTGSLASVANGSAISITGGGLVTVAGGSVFALVGGSLVTFGAGTNALTITNLAALCGTCSFAASGSIPNLNTSVVPVLLTNGASASNVTVASNFIPFAGLSANNTVTLTGPSAAVLVVNGATSKVKLGP